MFDQFQPGKKPDDIFGGVDPTPSTGSGSPTPSAPASPPPLPPQASSPSFVTAGSPPMPERAPPASSQRFAHLRAGEMLETGTMRPQAKKMTVVFLGVLLLLFLAGVIFFFASGLAGSLFQGAPSTISTPSRSTSTPPTPSTAPEQFSNPDPDFSSPPPESTSALDQDRDGLSDREETTLGTDLRSPDTDRDGLFDREERDVYRTNPLLADTDGDSFLDGVEVSNGYNPNGPGKLFEIPSSNP